MQYFQIIGRTESTPFVLSSFRRAKPVASSIMKCAVEPTKNIQAKPSTDINIPRIAPLMKTSIIRLPPSKTQENAWHLLHLFSFCRSITTNHVDWAAIESCWFDQLFEQLQAKDNPVLASSFFPQFQQISIQSSLLQLVGLRVLVWLFEPATILWCTSFFQSKDIAVLDTRCLHEVYQQWVDNLTIALNSVLSSFDETLETVALQLATDSLPPSHSQAIGFQPFVTIMRESFMVRLRVTIGVFGSAFDRLKTIRNLRKSWEITTMASGIGSPICQPSQY
jgi:hypothetical protein